MPEFTWERGPFEKCPSCGQERFGLLDVGEDRMVLRCADCRYSDTHSLPPLDKRVIYVDQFFFTLLFNVESGGRLPPGHESFAVEAHRRLKRLILLQQVVLPHSDVHHDETTVFHSAEQLRSCYEQFGGDARFMDTREIERFQAEEFATAWLKGTAPTSSSNVDDVLDTERNGWLPRMHIQVTANYGMFADGIRSSRDETHDALQRLAARWANEKPPFDVLLEREFRQFFERPQLLLEASQRMDRAADNGDPMSIVDALHSPIFEETRMLQSLFREGGIPEERLGVAVSEFWKWQRNLELPHHRISCYLFAALGRRVVAGQKTIGRGMMNDIRAISAYAPYVDAMFVDNECSALLAEEPLLSELDYKARIFSLSRGEAFLQYLAEIEEATPVKVRDYAARLYGV
jgi:hypothetical protein